MRTDYKIGIAVVLFLAVLIVVYNVFAPPQTNELTRGGDDGATPALPTQPVEQPEQYTFENPEDDDVIESIGDSFLPKPVQDDSIETDPTTQRDTETEDDITVAPREDPTSINLAAEDPDPIVEMPESGQLPEPIADEQPDPVTSEPRTTRERTYTVKKGDNGFWTISKKVYGHGKYYYRIQQANPNVDSNALRAGQKIRVPALSGSGSRTSSSTQDSRLGQIVEIDGKRYYFVKENDRGFWTISKEAYNTGKYYYLIKKANPKVDSNTLQPGQKIYIPPLPSNNASSNRSAESELRRPLKPGERVYTVKKGDDGFWDVAEKAYGSGKHWKKVQRANPHIGSEMLYPGQKLIIPSLDD